MRQVFLDHNTTTPVAPAVRDAMWSFLGDHYGSPASGYSLGRAAQEAMEDAREQVGALIAADREEIVFTAGESESNNLALKGLFLRQAIELGGHLIISAVDSPSVQGSAQFLRRLGFEVSIAPVDADGRLSPETVAPLLKPNTMLASFTLADPETGIVQPVSELAELCRSRGVVVHVDATFAAGKMPLSVDDLSVDMLTYAAHTMHGPKGVGALFIRGGVVLEPLIHGAGEESGLRSGVENVPGIMGFGKAASMAGKLLEETRPRMTRLRDRLAELLRNGIGTDLRVFGERVERLPNTLCVAFPNVNAGQLLELAQEVNAWTAVPSRDDGRGGSPTLAAMGVAPRVARGAATFSVGWFTTEEEIDFAAGRLLDAWERLRG
jgi:cysteine desulfurase